MKNRKLLRGYAFVIISALIFGLMPLMAKHIYAEGVNPPTLVFLRNIISVPVLILLALLNRNSLKIKTSALPGIGVIALMGCCITPLLLFSSYNHIPSGTATVFHFIYPAVVVIGEFIFFKSKLKRGHLVSVILCILGIALFYNPENGINFKGGFLALLSGITYATYVICLSNFRHKEIPSFTFSLYVTLISSTVMFCACLFTNQLALPQSITGWLLSLLFAIAVNVGAVVLFQRGTFLIGGGRASILSTFEPITSILAGVMIFQESVTFLTVIGSIFVIAASVMIAISDIRSSKKETLQA